MERLKKLLRLVIVVAVLVSGIRAINIWSNYESEEPVKQFVERVHDFYIDSGYNTRENYVKDWTRLQDIMQVAVDSMTLKQTDEFLRTKKTSNEWAMYVLETIKLNEEGSARVPKPEYLGVIYGEKPTVEKKLSPSELVFQNLLK